MSLEIKVPEVGESITEVTIASWLKKDGDFIEQDQIIAELESDKATFELPAEISGVLKIMIQEGETVDVGSIICKIEDFNSVEKQAIPSEQNEKKSNEVNQTPTTSGEIKTMVVPEVGESISEVNISNWLKKDGEYVKIDEIIAEVESDKATFELPAEANGVLRIIAKEGDTLEIGAKICDIEVTEMSTSNASSELEKVAQPTDALSESMDYAKGHPSPAAAKIMREKGIPTTNPVVGSGVSGRVTKQDAKEMNITTSELNTNATSDQTQQQNGVNSNRVERREKLTSLRKTIAKRLVSVKNETAMLTTFNEVDMKPIMDLRSKYKDKFKEIHGVGLGFMSFFTKACCEALKEWPAVNASIQENEMIYHDYCDISIAVSSPKGLVVPVIRNAEMLGFDEIESEVVRLATKARDGKLSIEEMQGGTFTITNGGIFGSMLSTPIINSPQSAILGMHNIVQRPVAINGEVLIRPIMFVALTYDHRIIDGRESVSFLVRIKQLLEDPVRLMLGV